MVKGTHQHPLHRVIVGALRDTINAHGSITPELIGSAAKRITAALAAYERNGDGS